jgi:HD-like signal output (HDOD) protein/CheY-like chemotaxis protein
VTRSILFVDDEPHLLAGLRRMLRFKRGEWAMAFASSGEEALALLAQTPVDVVVSDMRMPGMDGAQLLAEVRRRYPSTSRIILSGHADRASIISAIGPTQQYLSKPCDVEVLVAALERVLGVRDLVTDDRLRRVLGDIESLPKPPAVYERMLAMASDPDCSLDAVVTVIEDDVPTSAEVLRLVNSSFFGLPARVESVARAVSLLGLETIQALAVAGAVFGSGGGPARGLDLHALSRRALHVAQLSKAFAVSDGWSRDAVHDAFFAGLLHEVGITVLAAAHPDQWHAVVERGPLDPWEAHDVQAAAFGCSATEASAYILGLWGFGDSVVAAIADQPARPGDLTATPAAHVLTVSRLRAHDPAVPVVADPVGFLTTDRLRAWDAAVAAQPALHAPGAPARVPGQAGAPAGETAAPAHG